MRTYDRKNKTYIEEKETQETLLHFLYHTGPGRFLLKAVTGSGFNRLLGCYYKSRLSRHKIAKFRKKFLTDTEEIGPAQFRSFNDFFIRRQRVEADQRKSSLLAPATSRLSVYEAGKYASVRIKHTTYRIRDIVGRQGRELAGAYENGLCLVFRLAVTDYHRYIFIDDGVIKDSWHIPGILHTVRPIAEKYRVYTANSRTVSVLATEHLGEIIQIEVGALTIGAIVNHPKHKFRRGEEKGYFEYGGSTVVLLLKQDKVKLDGDIIAQSKKGVEVRVSAGEKIGVITGM